MRTRSLSTIYQSARLPEEHGQFCLLVHDLAAKIHKEGDDKMKKDESKPSDKHICSNPCNACSKKGILENGEVCNVCGGSGCTDQDV